MVEEIAVEGEIVLEKEIVIATISMKEHVDLLKFSGCLPGISLNIIFREIPGGDSLKI